MRTNTNRAARLIVAAERHREEHHEGGACDMPSGSPRYGTLHCPAPELYDEAAALLPREDYAKAQTLAMRTIFWHPTSSPKGAR